MLRLLAAAIALTLSMSAQAECFDKIQACIEEGSACSNDFPTGDRCAKKAKACILRIDECPRDVKTYFVQILNCSEKGYTYEQCSAMVKK